jgi:hypothetical protein
LWETPTRRPSAQQLFTAGQPNGVFANIQNDIFINNGSEMWLVNYDNANGFVEITAETHATSEPDTLLLLMPGLPPPQK